MTRRRRDRNDTIVNLLTVAFVVAALYFAREVVLPLALAALFAFLLTPLVAALERRGLGRVPAVLIAFGLAAAVVGGIGWVVADQMIALARELPKYHDTLLERVHAMKGPFGATGSRLADTFSDLMTELTGVPPDGAAPGERVTPVRIVDRTPAFVGYVTDWLGPLLMPFATAVIVAIFTIFMLVQREDLRDRMIRLSGPGRLAVTTQALDEAGARVSRYLLMLLLVNGSYGVLVTLGLWAIGLPNAVLWGLIAGVLRFVPYVGPWAAAFLPVLLSLAVGGGWGKPALTLGLYVALELLVANFVEPYLYGSSTGVSMTGLLAMASFWTWLWGVPGLVLSMPLTVCLVVLGRYVPRLAWLNVLLGDAPALDFRQRYYQRLLAFDDHEAAEVVGQALKDGSVEQLYNDVLMPALSLAERDRHSGELTDEQRAFVYQSVRDAVEELGERARTPDQAAAEGTNPRAVRVWCVPAEGLADEIAGTMAAQIMTAHGYTAEALPAGKVDEALLKQVAADAADAVLISAVAPGGVTHARRLCRQVGPQRPGLAIIVGLWNATGPLEQSEARLKTAGADAVAVSFDQALKALEPTAADRPPEPSKLGPAPVAAVR